MAPLHQEAHSAEGRVPGLLFLLLQQHKTKGIWDRISYVGWRYIPPAGHLLCRKEPPCFKKSDLIYFPGQNTTLSLGLLQIACTCNSAYDESAGAHELCYRPVFWPFPVPLSHMHDKPLFERVTFPIKNWRQMGKGRIEKRKNAHTGMVTSAWFCCQKGLNSQGPLAVWPWESHFLFLNFSFLS